MFFHRLKIEFRENRIYLALWFLVLATLTIFAISSWNAEIKLDPITGRLDNAMADFIGLLIIPVIFTPIVCTITTFRQDNLKDPSAFWNTRPVRPATLHTAKFIFLHLALTLPLTLCTFLISINALTFGDSMVYSAEAALWCSAAIHLAALASLHNHQWSKLLLLPATGFLGILFTAFLVNKLNLASPNPYNPSRSSANLLFTTSLLLIVFVIGGIALIKKPQLKFPIWSAVLVGSLTFPLLTANWLPNLSTSSETIALEPSEPIDTFTTGTTNHNGQYYYLLNYALSDLLPDSDRTPINLLSQQIDLNSLSEIDPALRVKVRSWNTGADQFPGEKNLQTIALAQKNKSYFKVSLSIEIPHNHAVQAAPKLDDLPRKNVTIEGEVHLVTMSLEDSFTIDAGQAFNKKGPGWAFSYLPSDTKNRLPSIHSKSFRLPLVSADLLQARLNNQDPFMTLRHRETGQFIMLKEGSGRGQHGMFGNINSTDIQDPKNTTVVHHYWKNRLQNQFPDFPDFDEWRKNTELQILPPERLETIRVPFKITIALPDVELLQQRLNELPK